MHPEIGRQLAAQHRAELTRAAARARQGGGSWRELVPRWPGWARARRWRAVPERLPQAVGATGVFPDAIQASGFRLCLTPAESRRLERQWARLLRKSAGREAHPGQRPAGAVPVEVMVLIRRPPEPAGAGRGLPGPGAA